MKKLLTTTIVLLLAFNINAQKITTIYWLTGPEKQLIQNGYSLMSYKHVKQDGTKKDVILRFKNNIFKTANIDTLILRKIVYRALRRTTQNLAIREFENMNPYYPQHFRNISTNSTEPLIYHGEVNKVVNCNLIRVTLKGIIRQERGSSWIENAYDIDIDLNYKGEIVSFSKYQLPF